MPHHLFPPDMAGLLTPQAYYTSSTLHLASENIIILYSLYPVLFCTQKCTTTSDICMAVMHGPHAWCSHHQCLRMQAECAERAAEIAAVLERLSTARRRGELLRATHAALQHRVAAATDAKLAALRGDSPSSCSAATAHSAVPHGDSHTTPGGPAAVPVATRLLLARRQKHGFRAPPAPPPGHLYTSATNEPGYAVLARRGEAQRTDSWHLFTPPDLLPPPLSTFRHHVAISYADLVEASGSHTAVISFGDAAAWELMNQCMAGVLRRLGCAARDVCWVAQMAYEAAPGLPLSYSCTLSTPECAASCVLFLQALNLEAALISAALQLPGATQCMDARAPLLCLAVWWCAVDGQAKSWPIRRVMAPALGTCRLNGAPADPSRRALLAVSCHWTPHNPARPGRV